MTKSSLTYFFSATFFLLTGAATILPAQSPANSLITTQPEKAIIYTNDVNNFWIAFDSLTAGYKNNPFNDFYIKKGSNGVQHFMDHNRIVNADTLLRTVINRKQDYLKIRDNSLKINEAEKQCRVSYFALKYLYPKAVFPPLYFVIGRFNTGGVSLPNEQIIGAEMNEPGNIPYIVAHELIHANQKIPYKYKILLEQCIIEGSADFLGELISGKIASTAPYLYAKGREKELMKEFLRDMNLGENDDFDYWLYSGPRKDDRPADMGYYIGYVITKAYYDKAIDKSRAIADILNIRDCKEFLQQSGYISQVESEPEYSQFPINQERFDLLFQESAHGHKWVYNGITHLFSIEINEENVKQVKYPTDISINKQVIRTAATPIRDTSTDLSNLSITRQKAILTAYIIKKAGKLAAQQLKKEWVTVNSKLWLLCSWPVIKNSVPTKNQRLIVSTVCFNQVLELNITVMNVKNQKKAKILLNQLMATLKLSNTPIDP